MKMHVRIEGTKDIRRKLLAMSEALTRETLVPIISDELEPMASEMRGLAARASGEMADSVTVSTELSPHQAAINTPIADVEVYAGPGPFVQAVQEEFGNYHQAPHPFIRPPFDSRVDQTLRRVGTAGVDAILDAAKTG